MEPFGNSHAEFCHGLAGSNWSTRSGLSRRVRAWLRRRPGRRAGSSRTGLLSPRFRLWLGFWRRWAGCCAALDRLSIVLRDRIVWHQLEFVSLELMIFEQRQLIEHRLEISRGFPTQIRPAETIPQAVDCLVEVTQVSKWQIRFVHTRVGKTFLEGRTHAGLPRRVGRWRARRRRIGAPTRARSSPSTRRRRGRWRFRRGRRRCAGRGWGRRSWRWGRQGARGRDNRGVLCRAIWWGR